MMFIISKQNFSLQVILNVVLTFFHFNLANVYVLHNYLYNYLNFINIQNQNK